MLEFSLAENLVLHDYAKAPFANAGLPQPRAHRRLGAKLLQEFDVRGGTPSDARVRALRRQPAEGRDRARGRRATRRVLIAAQPTRGLDVGAIEFVHRRLVEERDEGRAVLLVSLELEEVLSLADRILVIYEGRIVGEFDPSVTEEELGIAMTGGERAAA